MGQSGTGARALVATVTVVVALGTIAVTATTSGASATDDLVPPGELRAVADDVRAATNAPGAIVALQRGRRAPVIVARGTRDRRGGGPIRTDDPFVVASVSKAFTAAVALALVEDGKLSLDDRVAGAVPGWDRRIRVRHLLNHRSGLPSWGNKDDPPDSPRAALEADLTRRYTLAEGLAPVHTMPLLAPPGRATHYSNANTILLGLVIEAVTGRPLVDAYHRYVLDPLRLRSTAYPPQEAPPRAPIPGVLYVDDAQQVELDTGQYPQDSNLTLGGPAAGMVSDAPDLLAFAEAFLRGSFPNRRLGRAAKDIDDGGSGLGILGFTKRGYCIFDGCPPGRRFPRYGFAGNSPGVAVRVVRDPRADTTVLVFANSSERGKLDPFVTRLLDRVQ